MTSGKKKKTPFSSVHTPISTIMLKIDYFDKCTNIFVYQQNDDPIMKEDLLVQILQEMCEERT